MPSLVFINSTFSGNPTKFHMMYDIQFEMVYGHNIYNFIQNFMLNPILCFQNLNIFISI